jgi:hypothetical protein
MKAGAEVVALGYPLSFDLGNDISVNRGTISQLKAALGKYEDLIKIDAAINPGNSGGPLINRRGEVIGVNTLGFTDAQNQNYAIAMSHAKPIIEDLQEGRNRNYIGLNLVPNTFADYFGTEDGMAIIGVSSGSPASQVGVQQADLLLKVESSSVNSEEDVCSILRSHGDGDQLRLQILRAATGEILEGEVTMGKVGAADEGAAKLQVVGTLAAPEEPAAEPTEVATGGDSGGGTGDAPADTSAVITSDFSEDNGDWPTGDTEDFSGLVVNGQYVMQLKTPQQYLTVSPDAASDVSDGAISTEVTIGGATGFAGVMMRYKDENDQRSMYVCWINNSSEFGCSKNVNNSWTVLVSPTNDSVIKPNDVNRITMAVIANNILFDINDKEVASFTDDSLTGGSAGFYIENFDEPVTAYYDNAAIVRP